MTSSTQLSVNRQKYDQDIELNIHSTDNEFRLQRFIHRIEETLDAKILAISGSWKGNLVQFRLKRSIPIKNILAELMKMPEVKKAEETRTVKQHISRQRIEMVLSTDSIADDHKVTKSISNEVKVSMTDKIIDSQIDTEGYTLKMY